MRVLAAVDEASQGEPPWVRAARAVAEQLGAKPVLVPGDHGGFAAEPDAFAQRLRELLAQ